ncbi:MAG: PEP-CTERM sorting domain-containing protein [Planctomycetota bacterium]
MIILSDTGSPGDFPAKYSANDYLKKEEVSIETDGNPATWQLCESQMLLPVNTDYIAVEVKAIENVFNDTSSTEYDGHFADAVSAEMVIVPEPTTACLFALGGLALLKKKR